MESVKRKPGHLKPIKILLVEDNLIDVEMIARAFAKRGLKNVLTVVRNGEQALDYLHHRGSFQNHEAFPRPQVILLDLNLPRIEGTEVLRQIKQDVHLRAIPVIIMTSSQREEDIARSYDLGGNTYIQKPAKFEDFMRVFNAIEEYWTFFAKLPTVH